MSRLLVLSVVLLIQSSLTTAAEPNIEAGEKHYQVCSACHGVEGEGNQELKAPRLTHLQPEYIMAQLKNFRAGIRGGEGTSEAARSMAPMAMSLPDDQAVADVAAYIPTLPGGRPPAAVNGDKAMGADYFNQFCGACHGRFAEGNTLMTAIAPTLAGASDWYLVTQLEAFRAGVRGVHEDDMGGRQMRPMSLLLPDEKAIEDVVTFLYSLGE
jgi:cytochrome c553